MPIDRYYTPQALADATGLCVSQCRTLIAQSPDRLCISRDPNSKKPRYAISEKGFNLLLAQQRERRQQQLRQKQLAHQAEEALPQRKRGRKPNICLEEGLNPDGTIMNSRQLKAAGLW